MRTILSANVGVQIQRLKFKVRDSMVIEICDLEGHDLEFGFELEVSRGL